MSEKLSKEQVKKVADLALISLSDEDLEKYSLELADIMNHIDELEKLDLDSFEPAFHPWEKGSVLREDVSGESLSNSDALFNAPSSDGGYFLAPPILEAE